MYIACLNTSFTFNFVQFKRGLENLKYLMLGCLDLWLQVKDTCKYFCEHKGHQISTVNYTISKKCWKAVIFENNYNFKHAKVWLIYSVFYFGKLLTFLIWLLSPEPVDIISMLIVKIEWDLKLMLEEILIIPK